MYLHVKIFFKSSPVRNSLLLSCLKQMALFSSETLTFISLSCLHLSILALRVSSLVRAILVLINTVGVSLKSHGHPHLHPPHRRIRSDTISCCGISILNESPYVATCRCVDDWQPCTIETHKYRIVHRSGYRPTFQQVSGVMCSGCVVTKGAML